MGWWVDESVGEWEGLVGCWGVVRERGSRRVGVGVEVEVGVGVGVGFGVGVELGVYE